MKKKAFVAAIIVSLVLTSLFGTLTVEITTAQVGSTQTSTASALFGMGIEGNFQITSPSNTTYNFNILNLNVTGRVVVGSSVRLFMNYSIDGQEPIALPVIVVPDAHAPLPMFGEIITNGKIVLPQLSDGSHRIIVYADLEASGPHLAQATVYFTVNAQPSETPTPTASPSQNPTSSPSPAQTTEPTTNPSPSPTQQPTLEPTMIPSSSPMGPYSPIDPYIILIPILIAVVVLTAALVYVKKHKRNPETP
jgi:hypothetical protein